MLPSLTLRVSVRRFRARTELLRPALHVLPDNVSRGIARRVCGAGGRWCRSSRYRSGRCDNVGWIRQSNGWGNRSRRLCSYRWSCHDRRVTAEHLSRDIHRTRIQQLLGNSKVRDGIAASGGVLRVVDRDGLGDGLRSRCLAFGPNLDFEGELANPDLVSLLQHDLRGDPLVIDERAIRAAEISNPDGEIIDRNDTVVSANQVAIGPKLTVFFAADQEFLAVERDQGSCLFTFNHF